jgi:MinD-like ATPase involved in chromosome partitioning or flagellar assembly
MANIVSIHSYRGGTGKSNLSANLSIAVARTGKRVAVIDTDIQSPGIHILFGLQEEDGNYKSLNDYLWGDCSISDAAFDCLPRLRERHPQAAAQIPAFFLIPSSIKTGEIARVLREGYDVGLLNDGIQAAIQELDLDFLFIDTHPGLNEETLLSIAISDFLFLLLRPDRQDFLGTAVTVEVSRKLDVPSLHLVMNNVLSTMDREHLATQAQATFQVPVAGMLPFSPEMVRLGSADIFSLCYPEHNFSKEVTKIGKVMV